MASKKKLLTSAIALGTAAALTLGGTFAWQSISQKAVNEASDIVNPGGRLHNDQHWVSARANDTNIYVENFTDPDNGGNDIYARVRLSEYMEIVMNYGIEGAETVEVVAGSKTAKANSTYSDTDATHKNEFEYDYAVHYFGDENATDDWWQWTTGETTEDSEETYFMPTFNKNKDSLLADLNGEYVDTLGGISNRGDKQYTYTEVNADSTAAGYEVYDGDVNTADEIGRDDLLDLIKNGENAANYETLKDNIALTAEKTHSAAKIGTTRGLIALSDWLELEEDTDSYWVYDDSQDEDGNATGDGWVYWSSAIKPGTTTGLLLDGIELKQVMDDTWYYAIDVQAQFVTADDLGKADNTGFYADGETVTENAEKLLEQIGMDMDVYTGTVTFHVKAGGNGSYGITMNPTAQDGYKLGRTGTGATASYSGTEKTFKISADVVDSNEKAVFSVKGDDTYTVTTPADGDSTYQIAIAGNTNIASFDASTCELTVNQGDPLNGLTVVATVGAVEYELKLYVIRDTSAIYAVFSNSDIAEGAYDMTFIGANWDASKATKAAIAGIDLDDLVYETSVYFGSNQFGLPFIRADGSTPIKNVLSVRFADEVEPTSLFQTFYNVGSAFADTEYRVKFDFTNLDTSNVTSLHETFYNANVEAMDLSTWNTSNVTSMYGLFEGCDALKTVTLGNTWNTSHVTSMVATFDGCKNLTLDCSGWDVTSVTSHTWFNDDAPGVIAPNWN